MRLAVISPRHGLSFVLLALAAATAIALATRSGPGDTSDAAVSAAGLEPAAAPVDIVATAERSHVAVGEPLPVRFELVNASSSAILALPSLDASDVGWRFPKIAVEIRDAGGNLVTPAPMGRCGLVNPLAAGDFVELAPGEHLDLLGDGTFGHGVVAQGIATPGVYEITLVYDIRFEGEETKQARPDADPAIDALIARVPLGVYRSNPIELEVTGF